MFKLFVVTNSPLLSEMAKGKLCLVMKRQGLLVQMNEAGILIHPACGIMEPLISGNIHTSWRARSTKMEARSSLKKLVTRMNENGLDKEIIEFKKLSSSGCDVLGVMVPEIIYGISHTPLFGVVDLLCRDQIEKEKVIRSKFDKRTIPKMTIPKLLKLRGKSSNIDDEDSPDLQTEDLIAADNILTYFQKIHDEEMEKRRKHLPKIYYGK